MGGGGGLGDSVHGLISTCYEWRQHDVSELMPSGSRFYAHAHMNVRRA